MPRYTVLNNDNDNVTIYDDVSDLLLSLSYQGRFLDYKCTIPLNASTLLSELEENKKAWVYLTYQTNWILKIQEH
ncbi:MAG: hypothetical protein WC679_00940 [Bacteroidales bacterium]